MKIQCRHYPEDIPWYLRYFVNYHFNSKEVEIGFSVPFKVYGKILWFAFPEWLLRYNLSECVSYIPDVVDPANGGIYMGGKKVKRLFGMVLILDENAHLHWKWWKNIKLL